MLNEAGGYAGGGMGNRYGICRTPQWLQEGLVTDLGSMQLLMMYIIQMCGKVIVWFDGCCPKSLLVGGCGKVTQHIS